MRSLLIGVAVPVLLLTVLNADANLFCAPATKLAPHIPHAVAAVIPAYSRQTRYKIEPEPPLAMMQPPLPFPG